MRWIVGLCVAFAIVFAMNAFLIYTAVSVDAQDELVPSYAEEPR